MYQAHSRLNEHYTHGDTRRNPEHQAVGFPTLPGYPAHYAPPEIGVHAG